MNRKAALAGLALDPTVPPIISVSCLEIGKPEAGAAIAARRRASACSKAWNRRSTGLGHADARVRNRELASWLSVSTSSTRTSTEISPVSVNLTALVPKLMRIWPSRNGSPTKWAGTCRLDVEDSSSPLADAFSDQVPDILQHLFEVEIDILDRQLAGLDLREVEESLMMPSRCWPERWILRT